MSEGKQWRKKRHRENDRGGYHLGIGILHNLERKYL
jgi:hypothetical protein